MFSSTTATAELNNNGNNNDVTCEEALHAEMDSYLSLNILNSQQSSVNITRTIHYCFGQNTVKRTQCCQS